tara:strand:+ start:1536 stop:1796 length:261 start_codon:yes stop_codon:yes gene_type:complete
VSKDLEIKLRRSLEIENRFSSSCSILSIPLGKVEYFEDTYPPTNLGFSLIYETFTDSLYLCGLFERLLLSLELSRFFSKILFLTGS